MKEKERSSQKELGEEGEMIKAQPGLPTKALGQAGEAGDKLLSHSGWAKNTTKCNEDKHR